MNLANAQNIILLGLVSFLLWISFEIFIVARDQIRESRRQREEVEEQPSLSGPGELTARIIHEISNPLSVIEGGVKELLQKTDDEIIKQDLAQILISAEHISKIVQNTRDYIFKNEGMEEDLLNLKDVIDDVLLFYSERLDDHQIELYLKNVDEIYLEVNRAQLEQVLLDLISTSMDAVEKLHEKWIEISAVKTDDHVRLSVRNSGHGISKEMERKILSYMKSEHDGDLHFMERPHTTFILDLPVPHERPA